MIILQLGTAGLSVGGVGNYINTLVKTPHCHFIATVPGEIRKGQVIPYKPKYNALSLWLRVAAVRKMLIQHNVDLIHAHTQRGGLVVLLTHLLTGVRYIYTPHGMRHTQKKYAKRTFHYLIEKLIIKYSNLTTVITDLERQQFPKYDYKIVKIKSVVDKNRHSVGLGQNKNLNSEPFRVPRVLMVGTVDSRKNYRLFLDVANLCPDVDFCWIGSGPDLKAVQKNSEGALVKNVNFVGYKERPEVYKCIEGSDIFWMTSQQEGLPLVLIEAMSLGTVVLSNHFLGAEELIKDQETGFLHAFNSVEDASRMLKFVLGQRKMMNRVRNNAFLIIDDYTDEGRFLDEYDKIYKGALSPA
jgi:glycosyltransferase involved in cell wall biosynthesis